MLRFNVLPHLIQCPYILVLQDSSNNILFGLLLLISIVIIVMESFNLGSFNI